MSLPSQSRRSAQQPRTVNFRRSKRRTSPGKVLGIGVVGVGALAVWGGIKMFGPPIPAQAGAGELDQVALNDEPEEQQSPIVRDPVTQPREILPAREASVPGREYVFDQLSSM